MKSAEHYDLSDSLHRLVKQVIDSGTCTSIEKAEAFLCRYRLHFTIAADAAAKPEHQACLLTGIALARRVCLGGVTVEGDVDVKLSVPLPLGQSLRDAVMSVGAAIADGEARVPTVAIGAAIQPRRDGFHIRTTYSGWRGGIVPACSGLDAAGPAAMPLACMSAAALAVNEAFLFMSTGSSAWGHRVSGWSLWNPDAGVDWLAAGADEPQLTYLPSRLWLIGLGHLGQAYLWGLGLLPFRKAADLQLVLQDTDIITPSTESTSILSDASLVGQHKTRAMAAWSERRGFTTAIHERRFDSSFRRHQDEPSVALCGIDNALGRAVLDQVGFDLVLEAGLGNGYADFQAVRLHTLPGSRPAAELWRKRGGTREDLSNREAYQRLIQEGKLDRCGATTLAGKSVGAPFVGAAAATLVLAEVLRVLHGDRPHQLIDLDLRCIEHRITVRNPIDYSTFNPGFVSVAA